MPLQAFPILLTFLLLPFLSQAQHFDAHIIQKFDNGLTCQGIDIYFNPDSEDIEITSLSMNASTQGTPTLSTENGELLGFSTGLQIYNGNGVVAENGENIAVGIQQELFIEYWPEGFSPLVKGTSGFIPITDSLFYYFHLGSQMWANLEGWEIDLEDNGVPVTGYSNGFYLSEIELRPDGGLYLPPDKQKQLIVDDFLVHNNLNFIKHANGEDWWIHVPKILTDEAYVLLLKSDGSIEEIKTYDYSDQNGRSNEYRHVAVSKDGTRTARLIVRLDSDEMNFVEVFDFDRCTGLTERILSDSLSINNTAPSVSNIGDIEFSANNRFLYLAFGTVLYQVDLDKNDPIAERETVGTWDGSYAEIAANGESILPSIFNSMLRLPNDKIMLTEVTRSPYIHFIENPDVEGVACNFVHKAITLPETPQDSCTTLETNELPDFPPYRMAALEQDCSTVTTESVLEAEPLIFPNPTTGSFKINNAVGLNLTIKNAEGKTKYFVSEIGDSNYIFNGSDLPPGFYFLHFSDKKSGRFLTRKLVIL